MTDATQFFLNRLMSQLSSDCSSAQARIRAATTMRLVKHASNVQANAMIRSLAEVRQALFRVHSCAEERMAGLLDQQMKNLESCQSSEQLRAEYGRLVRNDWCFLRGDFGSLAVRADREYRRLLHTAVQREKESAGAQQEQDPDRDDEEGSSPAP